MNRRNIRKFGSHRRQANQHPLMRPRGQCQVEAVFQLPVFHLGHDGHELPSAKYEITNIGTSCARKDADLTGRKGKPNSFNYRMYLRSEQGPVSPFHDVPLVVDLEGSEVNMVVELPRWSNAKMEVNTREPLNPIMQDSTRGRMRYLANVFPYHGVPWNYGALPQTWENPHQVLGALALIDQGESDWKIITIDTSDPLAPLLQDIADVDRLRPGLLSVTVDWFRMYKIPDGKPENNFAFEGKAKGRMLAMRIVQDMHRNWAETIKKRSRSGGLVLTNTT
ncbi:Inorganic pyrophosphatase, partial [Gryllus bimaculatus]